MLSILLFCFFISIAVGISSLGFLLIKVVFLMICDGEYLAALSFLCFAAMCISAGLMVPVKLYQDLL